MCVHHAFGVACGARCEEHGGHVIFGADLHLFFEKVRVLFGKDFACCQQLIHRAQTGFVVFAQTAWVVVINVCQCGIGFAHFQHFVDLLLVFDHAQTHFGVGHGENTFSCDGVLVQGNWNGTQRLRRQHGGVKTGAVRAHDNHVLAALQACLVQAASHVGHHGGHVLPVDGLPNAIFFFAHGGRLRALSRVLE